MSLMKKRAYSWIPQESINNDWQNPGTSEWSYNWLSRAILRSRKHEMKYWGAPIRDKMLLCDLSCTKFIHTNLKIESHLEISDLYQSSLILTLPSRFFTDIQKVGVCDREMKLWRLVWLCIFVSVYPAVIIYHKSMHMSICK